MYLALGHQFFDEKKQFANSIKNWLKTKSKLHITFVFCIVYYRRYEFAFCSSTLFSQSFSEKLWVKINQNRENNEQKHKQTIVTKFWAIQQRMWFYSKNTGAFSVQNDFESITCGNIIDQIDRTREKNLN